MTALREVRPEREEEVTAPVLRVVEHLHTWRLVADENDGYGQVRSYECVECEAVRYL